MKKNTKEFIQKRIRKGSKIYGELGRMISQFEDYKNRQLTRIYSNNQKNDFKEMFKKGSSYSFHFKNEQKNCLDDMLIITIS